MDRYMDMCLDILIAYHSVITVWWLTQKKFGDIKSQSIDIKISCANIVQVDNLQYMR